jgi:hypothetical protein
MLHATEIFISNSDHALDTLSFMFFISPSSKHFDKSNTVPLHAMKALEREKLQLLLIHDFDTGWGEWSASRPGLVFPRGKDPLYPLYRRPLRLDTETRGKII